MGKSEGRMPRVLSESTWSSRRNCPWISTGRRSPAPCFFAASPVKAIGGLNDLMAGGVEFVTCSLPEARALIDAGKVRALAIMSDKPDKIFPNVPTLKSATGSNWTVGAWRGMAGPKGMPREIVNVLNQQFNKAVNSPDLAQRFSGEGIDPIGTTPEQTAMHLESELKKFANVIKERKMKAD